MAEIEVRAGHAAIKEEGSGAPFKHYVYMEVSFSTDKVRHSDSAVFSYTRHVRTLLKELVIDG